MALGFGLAGERVQAGWLRQARHVSVLPVATTTSRGIRRSPDAGAAYRASNPRRIDLSQSRRRLEVLNEGRPGLCRRASFKEGCMRAKQVMSRLVHTVAADASVYDAAQVLLNSGVSAAPVVDADGSMIGIVSEADLMYRT